MSGGAEPNQPNTINNSCADGTSATFHSDESNDGIVVATTDGSAMAAGKTGEGQRNGLGFTAPVPPMLSTSTTPPTPIAPRGSGSLQAVRANFRHQGSASSCSTGAYDDHDDLIFAVCAGPPGFTVSASPSAVSVTRGSTATSNITVTSQNGFNSATTASASELPAGVTAAFSTNPVTPPANGSATSR